MIDLTNRTTEEVNALIQKYAPVLELYNKKQADIPYLAVILEVGVNYLKTNYAPITIEWKTWMMVILKDLYFKKALQSEADIPKSINDFILFHNQNYENYVKEIVSVSEFDRDKEFVHRYINKKG